LQTFGKPEKAPKVFKLHSIKDREGRWFPHPFTSCPKKAPTGQTFLMEYLTGAANITHRFFVYGF
jgi:hypothetical protein